VNSADVSGVFNWRKKSRTHPHFWLPRSRPTGALSGLPGFGKNFQGRCRQNLFSSQVRSFFLTASNLQAGIIRDNETKN
jgi:hypothetical protein